MREYNDYTNMIRSYLKRYNEFKATIDILRLDIADKEEELSLGAPIAKYGDEPGGGAGEFTVTERQAIRRKQVMDAIERSRADIRAITSMITKLERALSGLPADKREVVKLHYIDGLPWMDVAEKLFTSESAIRAEAHRSIKRLSDMYFNRCNMQLGLFEFAEM